MNLSLMTLWDLLVNVPQRRAGPSPASASSVDGKAPARRRAGSLSPPAPRNASARRRYDALVAEMKVRYAIRVRKWRTSTTGCAWEVHYHDGAVSRLIEAPYPRGPMSCAVFLHEVGHHAIGFRRYRPRCLEEFHAWMWALDAMRARGFNVTPAVERRVRESLRYAVRKAQRRGLKRIPAELLIYAANGASTNPARNGRPLHRPHAAPNHPSARTKPLKSLEKTRRTCDRPH